MFRSLLRKCTSSLSRGMTRCGAALKAAGRACLKKLATGLLAATCLGPAAQTVIDPSPASATDVAFVIDVSGSMSKLLPIAKEGALLGLPLLDDSTTLHIVGFSDTATRSTVSLATDRAKAREQIQSLRTRGGTDYLTALRQPIPKGSRVIWLSDGAHGGSPEAVKEFIRRNLEPKEIVLSTISIGCAPGSKAGRLLAEMAALTKGVNINLSIEQSSEKLVETMLSLVEQASSYRRCRPTLNELTLAGVTGRVIALSYSADVALLVDGKAFPGTGLHNAKLPQENVQLRWLHLGSPKDVTIRMVNPQSTRSRLGVVFRADLPQASLHIPTAAGRVPAEVPVHVEVSLKDAQGLPVDARQMSSAIEVTGPDGRVSQTVKALPAPDRSVLQAEVRFANEGPHNVRAVTSIQQDGVNWTSVAQATVKSEKARTVRATPSRLKKTVKAGTFHETVALQLEGAVPGADTWAATLQKRATGLQLVAATPEKNGVKLQFEASSGVYRGAIQFSHSSGLAAPLEVPFELTVEPAYRGLAGPRRRTVRLGTVVANSGPLTAIVSLRGQDDRPLACRISVRDLAVGSGTVIPTDVQAEVILKPNAAAQVRIKADIGSINAGEYRGQLIVTPKEAPKDKWVIDLVLTVSDAVTAKAVAFGNVGAGGTSEASFKITNRSQTPARLEIQLPRSFHLGARRLAGIELHAVQKSVVVKPGETVPVPLVRT